MGGVLCLNYVVGVAKTGFWSKPYNLNYTCFDWNEKGSLCKLRCGFGQGKVLVKAAQHAA